MPFRCPAFTSRKPPTNSLLLQVLTQFTHSTIQIMKCLTRHEKPLEEAGAWTLVFGPQGPPQEMAQISIDTAHICAEAQVLSDSSERDDGWKYGLLGIIKEAMAVDLLYQSWIDNYSICEPWRYQTVYHPPNDALPANGMVQVHHDLYTGYIWASCCGKRAHLLEVSLHCLSLLGCHSGAKNLSMKLQRLHLDENLLTRFQSIIEDMISGICATVPFMLGDIDSTAKLTSKRKRIPLAGFMLLWPLLVARTSSNEGSEREAWINARLGFIDSGLGIKYGRLIANKIKKERWELS